MEEKATAGEYVLSPVSVTDKIENFCLKAKLLSVYRESDECQIKKLVCGMELGDQQPSHLLRKMRELARGRVTDETLRVMWKNQLPPSIRSILAVSDEANLEKLASIADNVAENATPVHSVASVKEASSPSKKDDAVIAEIRQLGDRLRRLESTPRGRSRNFRSRRSRSRSGSHSRSTKAMTSDDPNWLCRYHFRFRNKATRVLNTPNRRILAKPQWIIQMRNYADLPKHTKVLLPAMSPTMEKGTIMSWAKKEGDKLSEGDLLCEIQTDKAAMGFEATEEGYLAKIILPTGAKDVPVGRPLCIIVADAADVAAFKDYKDDSPAPAAAAAAPPAAPAPAAAAPAPAPAAPAPAPTVAPPAPAAAATGDRVLASPMARRLAAIKSVRLGGTGSGLYGSLKSTDLSAMGAAAPAAAAGAPFAAAESAAPAPAPGATYVDIPLSSMRATIAQRLAAAKQTTPHFQLTATVNVEKTVAMRKRINKKLAAEKADVKLSMNDFIIKAVAAACKRVPEVNAYWMDTFIRQFVNVDVSVAVATPTGLITPILFSCDARGIIDISKNMKQLAAKAKEGKLQPQEFMGGTVTVSNLGMFGITMFNAIINPPQSLIIACGGFQDIVISEKNKKSKDKDSKSFRSAKFVTFTASANHRVIDGAVGALWMKVFKENMEDPANMIL